MNWLAKALIYTYTALTIGLGSGCDTIKSRPDLASNSDGIEEILSEEKQGASEVEDKKYAVLLIDSEFDGSDSFDQSIHRKYEKPLLYNLKAELPNMAAVLQQANSLDMPVFDINFEDVVYSGHRDESTTTKELAKYREDNWISLKKPESDAFNDTNLNKQLQELGVTDLILMGIYQNACVKATAQTAVDLGYSVHTSFDVMQGLILGDCELFFNGVSHGIQSYCADHPFYNVTSEPVESGIEELRIFYGDNTNLVQDYTDLPIFDS